MELSLDSSESGRRETAIFSQKFAGALSQPGVARILSRLQAVSLRFSVNVIPKSIGRGAREMSK
jgi:hypothetical protein